MACGRQLSSDSKFEEEQEDEESPLIKLPQVEDVKKALLSSPRTLDAAAGAVNGAMLGLLYIMVSAGMLLSIKFLMHPDRFPFAICLTSFHLAASFGLAVVLFRLYPELFPSVGNVFRGYEISDPVSDAKGTDRLAAARGVMQFVPIAFFGALSIVVGNSAFMHAQVSFLQMVKEGHVVIVYALMIVFGLESLRWQTCLVLACVAVSAAVAVNGMSPVSFTMIGLSLQLLAGLVQSMQVVLVNRMMSLPRGPQVDPLTMVMCTAPIIFCAILPLNYVFWDPRIPGRILEWWPYLVGNMVLAFVLQVVSALTIKGITATGHALASVLKDLGIVLAAATVVGGPLSLVQLLGYAGSVCGIAMYAAMKVCPEWLRAKSGLNI